MRVVCDSAMPWAVQCVCGRGGEGDDVDAGLVQCKVGRSLTLMSPIGAIGTV